VVKYLVFDIVAGQSDNYGRLEWFLDSARRRGDFDRTNLEVEIAPYVKVLLPLIRDPKASRVLEKARLYFGLDWSRVVDPLPDQDPEQVVFYLLDLMVSPDVIYFDPLQPEVRRQWLEYCIEFDPISAEEESLEPERLALDWLLSNYPGRDDSTAHFTSFSRYTVPDSMGIDLYGMILRFFGKFPRKTLEKILEHRQMDLWDELSTEVELEEHEAQILRDVACVAGLNSIVEMYQKQYPGMGSADAGNYRWFRLQTSFHRIRYSLHPELPEVKRVIPRVEALFESKQEYLRERLKLLI
jgi:hypothetical protein